MPRFHADTDDSAGPPPEVLAEIDAAWERAQELFNDERSSCTSRSTAASAGLGRAAHRDGTIAETLSASEAVDVACGSTTRAAVAAPARRVVASYSGGHGHHTQGPHLRRRRPCPQGRDRRDRPPPSRSRGRGAHHQTDTPPGADARGRHQDGRRDVRLHPHAAHAGGRDERAQARRVEGRSEGGREGRPEVVDGEDQGGGEAEGGRRRRRPRSPLRRRPRRRRPRRRRRCPLRPTPAPKAEAKPAPTAAAKARGRGADEGVPRGQARRGGEAGGLRADHDGEADAGGSAKPAAAKPTPAAKPKPGAAKPAVRGQEEAVREDHGRRGRDGEAGRLDAPPPATSQPPSASPGPAADRPARGAR